VTRLPADNEGFVDYTDGGGSGPRVAVKDLIAVAGCRQTAGLACHAERRAREDADVVARFRGAGFQIVGTTHTDMAGFGTMTPQVPNPRFAGRAVGGSSGGAAAAVAAGAADLGIGTDTGGSIRIPAAYCGLWAFKASNGRVPMEGVIPLSTTFDALGLVADDAEMLGAGARVLLPDFARGAVSDPRVAIDGDALNALDPSIAPKFAEVAEALNAETFILPVVPYGQAARTHSLLVSAEAFAHYARDPAFLCGDFPDVVMEGMRQASEVPEGTIATARRRIASIASAADRAFDAAGIDVMIAPTLPMPPADRDAETVTVNGRNEPITNANIRLTFMANVAGLRVVVAPIGDLSVQFIGRRGHDERLLAHAGLLVARVNGSSLA